MKTKTPADPATLKALVGQLERAGRGPAASLPLHARLRAAMVGNINAGHWTAGERLPTEAELAAATGLSAGTVQRALHTLTADGIVRRRQGSGSYVAETHHRIDDVAHCRFLGDDGKTLLPVFSRALSRRAWRRAGPWSRHFDAKRAEVVRVDRVLNVNGEFDVYSRFFFDGLRFQGLATRPLGELAGTNFKVLLREEAQVRAGALSQTLQQVAVPADVGSHIGVEPDAMVSLLEIVRHANGGGDVVYFQQMFVPPVARKLVTNPAS